MSLKDNALPHIGKEMILKLDIKNFFESIFLIDVYNSSFNNFSSSVSMLLAHLCTYSEHLMQSSPTSAYISNLVLKDFDETIGKYCLKNNITYTRYSDDMTFSDLFNPSEIIKLVRKNLNFFCLELNDSKIHIIKKSRKQCVTCIVVNEKINISSEYRKKIRQEVFYIQKYGLKSHLSKLKDKTNNLDCLKKLYDKILYVLQICKDNKEFMLYKQIIKELINNFT